MKLELVVKKEECTESCPLPLPLLVNMKKGIRAIDYDEKTGKTVIDFDEKVVSKEDLFKSIAKMKYTVLKA